MYIQCNHWFWPKSSFLVSLIQSTSPEVNSLRVSILASLDGNASHKFVGLYSKYQVGNNPGTSLSNGHDPLKDVLSAGGCLYTWLLDAKAMIWCVVAKKVAFTCCAILQPEGVPHSGWNPPGLLGVIPVYREGGRLEVNVWTLNLSRCHSWCRHGEASSLSTIDTLQSIAVDYSWSKHAPGMPSNQLFLGILAHRGS